MSRPNRGPQLRANPKRGGTFYIYWTDEKTSRGRERSTGTSDFVAAHAEFARWLAERGPEPWTGPRRPSEAKIAEVLALYAEDAAERVAATATVGYAIDRLLDWWGDRTCDAVKPETCRAYVKARMKRAKESTAARELTVLRSALGHAYKNGKITERPFVEVPSRPPGRDRWLTRSEVAQLLWESRKGRSTGLPSARAQARRHLPLFIMLALYTGARSGALFDLRWTQVDLERGRIDLNPSGRRQTSKRRPWIPIPRSLHWFLRHRQETASTPYVLSYNGNRIASVKRSFREAVARAGLKDVVPYTLRHTCGTWMAQKGVPLREIGGYLGHSSERTTELYAHHHPDYLKAAKRAME